ncbi:MAG TPA: M48 family metallopeptidase [Blastocatellia bacterium]|nr:M48 family metallopeptidase [Blastocatellia bacterium]
MHRLSLSRASVSALVFISMLALPISLIGQTRVVAPKNPYSLAKDVQLGQQAASEVERQMPILNDYEVQAYVERVGRRLAEGIPAQFQHPEFRYSFKVVDTRDLNAFALPGGFTYVNRGLIEAAHNEGEMAGAMAHEISHVALRHGTAQAAKAQKYQAGAAVVGILGAILGAPAAGQLGQMGIGAYFLKFSREYEKQADLLGAQIMANAGYDPHDLANMFRTLEQQGGSGGPQWLSDHPNPGNRFEYINREADALRVKNPTRNTTAFNRVQALLREMRPARSMQEIGRSSQRNPQRGDQRYPDQDDQRYPQQGGRRQPVEYPSSRFRNYSGNYFRISVPENWRELPSNDGVTFAPDGAYRDVQSQFVFTHGIQVGAVRAQSNSLRTATDELIRALAQGNQNLRRNGGYQRETLGRRDALAVSLTNISEMTGRPEHVTVYTTMLRSGDLFYLIAVAPQDEIQDYQRTFTVVLGTVSVND